MSYMHHIFPFVGQCFMCRSYWINTKMTKKKKKGIRHDTPSAIALTCVHICSWEWMQPPTHLRLTFRTFSALWCCPPWYCTLHCRLVLWSALVGWKVRSDVTLNWPPSSVCVFSSFSPGWFHLKTGGAVGQEWSTEQDAACAPVTSSFTDKRMGSGAPATRTMFMGEELRADHYIPKDELFQVKPPDETPV